MTRLAAIAGVALSLAAASPISTSRPAIVGTLQQGSRLTANPGSWSAAGSVAFAYQWYRCDAAGAHCSSIHGATKGSYTQVRADVGHTLAATIQARSGGETSVAYTPLAGVVAASTATFAAAAQPSLAGEAFVGRTLSVSAVRWTAAAPAATVRWLRCNANGRLCAHIDGAKGVSYTITTADAGRVLVAVVTSSKQSVLSGASAVVRTAPGPLQLAPPAISGTAKVGAKLAGNAGVWSGGGTISYTYQWYRCDARGAACSTVRGATRNTYTQVAADGKHTLALTVHATDSTGTTAAYSSLVGVVAPQTASLAAQIQPSLGGIPAVGQPLRVTGATFTAKPSSLTYAWLRCTPAVRSCSPIAGAVQDAYTVTKDDAGHAVVASVTTVAAGERLVTLTTAATIR